MSVNQLLSDLRDGNLSEAFEASKELSRLSRAPVKRIIAILKEADGVHNREAAAYALSWIRRKNNEPLQALLNAFADRKESASVRAQALEGFGIHGLTKRHRLWKKIEAAIKKGLADKSAEVRFWACYAAGQLKMKAALPQLRELEIKDKTICPNWWRVSEEASDAIERIYGRQTPDRLPISNHNGNQ